MKKKALNKKIHKWLYANNYFFKLCTIAFVNKALFDKECCGVPLKGNWKNYQWFVEGHCNNEIFITCYKNVE